MSKDFIWIQCVQKVTKFANISISLKKTFSIKVLWNESSYKSIRNNIQGAPAPLLHDIPRIYFLNTSLLCNLFNLNTVKFHPIKKFWKRISFLIFH